MTISSHPMLVKQILWWHKIYQKHVLAFPHICNLSHNQILKYSFVIPVWFSQKNGKTDDQKITYCRRALKLLGRSLRKMSSYHVRSEEVKKVVVSCRRWFELLSSCLWGRVEHNESFSTLYFTWILKDSGKFLGLYSYWLP